MPSGFIAFAPPRRPITVAVMVAIPIVVTTSLPFIPIFMPVPIVVAAMVLCDGAQRCQRHT